MDKRFFSLLVAGLLVSGIAHAQTVLDDFGDDQPVVADETSDGSGTTGAALTVGNGGQRTLSVDCTSGCAAGTRVSALVGGGLYRYSQDSGTQGRGTVTWSGLNVDLTGNTIVELVGSSDNDGYPVRVTLTTASGSATLTSTVQPSFTTLRFNFSGTAGIDPSQVTGLQLVVDGTTGTEADLNLDQIRAVSSGEPAPAPAPGISLSGLIAALIGLPLIAGFFASRRRKAS